MKVKRVHFSCTLDWNWIWNRFRLSFWATWRVNSRWKWISHFLPRWKRLHETFPPALRVNLPLTPLKFKSFPGTLDYLQAWENRRKSQEGEEKSASVSFAGSMKWLRWRIFFFFYPTSSNSQGTLLIQQPDSWFFEKYWHRLARFFPLNESAHLSFFVVVVLVHML